MAAAKPADWVPVRWPWIGAASLELLDGTPVNCLLLRHPTAEFTAAAAARGLVTLAVVMPGEDAQAALKSKPDGIVFEGDFLADPAPLPVPVIELAPRYKMKLGGNAPVIGTYQGVWPGIAVDEGASKHAGPTLRSGSIPTPASCAPCARFGAAHASGWRTYHRRRPWSPPRATCRRSPTRQSRARAGWSRSTTISPPAWPRAKRRAMGAWKRMAAPAAATSRSTPNGAPCAEGGRLAVVQDPDEGRAALRRHPGHDRGEAHAGAADSARSGSRPTRWTAPPWRSTWMRPRSPPEQKEVLRGFTRGGGTLLDRPARMEGSHAAAPARSRWRRPNWSGSTTFGATSTP